MPVTIKPPRESVLALFDPLLADAQPQKVAQLSSIIDRNEPLVEVDEEEEEEAENLDAPEIPSMIVPLAYSPGTPLREILLDDIHDYATPPLLKQVHNRRPPHEIVISPPPAKKIGAPRESTFTRIVNEIQAAGLPFGFLPPRPVTQVETVAEPEATVSDGEPPQPEPSNAIAPKLASQPPNTVDTTASPSCPPGFLEEFHRAIQVPDFSFDQYPYELSVDQVILDAAEKYQGGGIVYDEDNKPIPPLAKFGWGTPVALMKQQKALAASAHVSLENSTVESPRDKEYPEQIPLPSTPQQIKSELSDSEPVLPAESTQNYDTPMTLDPKSAHLLKGFSLDAMVTPPLLSSTPMNLPKTNLKFSAEDMVTHSPLTNATPNLPIPSSNQTQQEMVTPVHRNQPAAAPPPVHALRIVKRVKRAGGPAATSAVDVLPRTISTGLAVRQRQTSVRSQGTFTTTHAASSRTAAPTRLASSTSTVMVTKAVHKPGAPITSGDGPRRVPITDPAAPAQQSKPKPTFARPALGSTRVTTASGSSLPRPNFTTTTTMNSKLPVAGRVASGSNRTVRRAGQ